jgi:anaerobic ribonucleoside-triphosphate reductase activating protein
MIIAINKVHFPVTTLGYGRRLGIWTQGCSIRCAGCISKDTWDRTAADEITVSQLVESCASWLERADGVTISGGEPFNQPEALCALIEQVRVRNTGDVLVYSGYSKRFVQESYPDILARVDVLISEPYRPDAGDSLTLRGSDNQRITLLTSLARRRYPNNIDHCEWPPERRLDVVVTDSEFWLAGIPRKGEMARLKAKLKGFGYDCTMSDEPEVRA